MISKTRNPYGAGRRKRNSMTFDFGTDDLGLRPRVEALAKRTGRTPSAVIREALIEFLIDKKELQRLAKAS